ncbi:MAG: helix-turn-helix domain-containing protein, partial [Candidatus Heimdallarchaeota archaeon]
MAKEEETIIDGLTTIGLTKYQAMVYIALVALGEGTAYVIAEKSAVPRAKVYETLDALVEKG